MVNLVIILICNIVQILIRLGFCDGALFKSKKPSVHLNTGNSSLLFNIKIGLFSVPNVIIVLIDEDFDWDLEVFVGRDFKFKGALLAHNREACPRQWI